MTEKELNEFKNSILEKFNALRPENVIDYEKLRERAEREMRIIEEIGKEYLNEGSEK